MSNKLYIGVRVEIANRIAKSSKSFVKKYNSSHGETQLFDLHKDGRITVEKNKNMLIARGSKRDNATTGMVNFSVMALVKGAEKDVERIVQIVNVLGNDRLIRERISAFVYGKSLLNAIPELVVIKEAFVDLDKIMPGLIKDGWYYAPEAIF